MGAAARRTGVAEEAVAFAAPVARVEAADRIRRSGTRSRARSAPRRSNRPCRTRAPTCLSSPSLSCRSAPKSTSTLPPSSLRLRKMLLHARDGARAVGGGGAARHDVDAVDQDRRDEVQVDAVALVRRHEAPAVHQVQRAAAEERIQAAQVGDRGAGEEVRVAGRGRRVVREVGGQLLRPHRRRSRCRGSSGTRRRPRWSDSAVSKSVVRRMREPVTVISSIDAGGLSVRAARGGGLLRVRGAAERREQSRAR